MIKLQLYTEQMKHIHYNCSKGLKMNTRNAAATLVQSEVATDLMQDNLNDELELRMKERISLVIRNDSSTCANYLSLNNFVCRH